MNKKPTPGAIAIMASGGVALLFSFFNFLTFGDLGSSAWGAGLFPLATYIPIIAVLLAVHVALVTFASVDLPQRVLGFTWTQIHLVFAVFSLLIAVGYLLLDKGGASLGIGYWFLLVASIGLVVGSVLEMQEGNAGGGSGAPPAPPAA